MSEQNKIQKEATSMNVSKIQKEAAKEGRKVHLNDRVKLEVLKDSGHYRKGEVINPHKIYAEALIKNEIAKAI